jgi:N6-L-threonylcarbamoyladenine synthase
MTRVLGIETSCDETGVAVVENERTILANEVASQIALHAQFGGVVPEIASRRHVECISQLTKAALEQAGGSVDAVAVTNAPGLMGALLVGVNFGKALSMAWDVPYVPVHHLEGHIFSALLCDDPPEWPFLALIVSGGHTCLVWCAEPHRYELIGSTRDDAVGECFDKVARLLNLPYPGGPSIQRAAEGGDPHAVGFPRGMAKGDSLGFSYSGLKTAVLYELQKNERPLADVAASFQYAAVDVLLIKTKLAIRKMRAKRLVLAGGVAANRLLRTRLQNEAGIPVTMPAIALCVDNGAMIAAAGASRLRHGMVGGLRGTASPSMPLR